MHCRMVWTAVVAVCAISVYCCCLAATSGAGRRVMTDAFLYSSKVCSLLAWMLWTSAASHVDAYLPGATAPVAKWYMRMRLLRGLAVLLLVTGAVGN
jgi:hypothetical protein